MYYNDISNSQILLEAIHVNKLHYYLIAIELDASKKNEVPVSRIFLSIFKKNLYISYQAWLPFNFVPKLYF